MPKPLSVPPASDDGDAATPRTAAAPPSRPRKPASTQRRPGEPPPPTPAIHGPPDRLQIDVDRAQPSRWRAWWQRVGRRQSSGCLISSLFHFLLLLSLALAVEASRPGGGAVGLIASTETSLPPGSAFGGLDQRGLTSRGEPTAAVHLRVGETATLPAVEAPLASPLDATRVPSRRHGLASGQPSDWLLMTDTAMRGALAGRGPAARAALVRGEGGNAASQGAVERGLRWMVAHQREDGSWNFNHHKSACRGRCRNPGTEASTTAATALALLPFLGAGYTHLEGEHRDVVRRGLYYLGSRALVTPHGIDLQEGSMYGQALAAIALCEAYAMTQDPALKDLAQGTIDFIVYAQDSRGGGWRYTPGEPGDTTVTGWQLMALKSGQMAELNVPLSSIYLARRFLASVQSYDGAQYGYMSPRPRRTTTAIGLLCRMYTGWRRIHPALGRGVMFLSQWQPSQKNIYYNYYATQVMHHWGGRPWEQWNLAMRDHLVATQATSGHEAGSWYFSDPYGDRGGRLYNTAMAVMTLEVYYRYMPLYRQQSVEEGF